MPSLKTFKEKLTLSFFLNKDQANAGISIFVITRNLDDENTDKSYSSNNVICHQWKTTIHSANDK